MKVPTSLPALDLSDPSELAKQFKTAFSDADADAIAVLIVDGNQRIALAASNEAALAAALEEIGLSADAGPAGDSVTDRAIAMLRGLSASNADLKVECEELGKALDKAKSKSKNVHAREVDRAISLKPMKDEDRLPIEELRFRIAAAETVEIAFSDGKKEVAALGRQVVSGDAWKDHPLGLMLTEPVEIQGPAAGSASVGFEGYALLLDGKPVAYTKRDPLMVAGGGKLKLENDIYF